MTQIWNIRQSLSLSNRLYGKFWSLEERSGLEIHFSGRIKYREGGWSSGIW